MKLRFLLLSLLISNVSWSLCNGFGLDPNLETTPFKHSINEALSLFNSHHSGSDVISILGQDTKISLKFTYGPLRQDLERESVELWLDTCSDKLTLLGVYDTDSEGRIVAQIPASQLPALGAFNLLARVLGDNSSTHLTVRVVAEKTRLVIFDIDGTLINSELDWTPRHGASAVTHACKDSGHEVIYLTGRHLVFANKTRNLLEESGFAEGTLMLAQSIFDIFPIKGSADRFKYERLMELKQMGFQITRGYGDSKTDIEAYRQADLAPEQIFILGRNGGVGGSVALGEDYIEHLRNFTL